MNMLEAVIIFDVLIIIYEILVSTFSALYELSGLTKDEARFQVTSLLTGTGFTTSESEKMLETKKRKRITRDIMILSYIFNVSIISTLVALFTSTSTAKLDDVIIGVIVSVAILILLIASKRIVKVRNAVDKLFLNIVKKFYMKIK